MTNLSAPPTIYDVVLYSSCGMAFNGDTPEEGGLGGSEIEVVVLADALTARGYKVLVMNPVQRMTVVRGVTYMPHIAAGSWITCRTLAVWRYSIVPNIRYEKLVIVAMDMPGNGSYDHHAEYVTGGSLRGQLVTMTKWHRSLFPADWNVRVVHPVVPEVVYEIAARKDRPSDPLQFVYASAALKGLSETIRAWREMKTAYEGFAEAKLAVTSPGYDSPDLVGVDLEALRISFKGVIPSFRGVVELINESAGLFYVNSFPETFSMTSVSIPP